MTSYTVTASSSAANSQGILFRVKVLTGATESGGASNTGQNGVAGTLECSVTPVSSNSYIEFALESANTGTYTAATGNTLDDNFLDSTVGVQLGTGFYSGTVTSGTAVTVGASNSTNPGTVAAYEVQPSGGSTPVVDGSSPAVVQNDSGPPASGTTASFSPPAGSVLVVAIAISDNVMTETIPVSVSSTPSLTWTQQALAAPSGFNFSQAAIFTATVPGGGSSGPALPLPQQKSRKPARGRRRQPQQMQGLPSGSVPANVAGVVSNVTVTSIPGVLEGDASTAGTTATVNVTAQPGTPAGGGNVAGVVSSVSVVANPGTLSGGANVTGVTATVNVTAQPRTPAGSANVTGVTANVVVGAPAGTPAGSANVTGVVTNVVVGAQPGTPSGGSGGSGNVIGVTATVTVTAPTGTPAGCANVQGVAASIAVSAPSGTPAGSASLTGVTASVIVTAHPGSFAGPLVEALLGGTVVVPQYAGTVSQIPYGGTVTQVPYGGTVTQILYGGTVKSGGPVVPVQQDITGNVVNDDVYANFAITYNGAPLNLTPYVVKVVLKNSRNVADSTGVTFTAGSGITNLNNAAGTFTLDVPHADLSTPLLMWYRCYLVDGSNENFTALYGNFQVLAA